MDLKVLAKKLNGFQTVKTVCKLLEVDKRTAINYIYALRKAGYVKSSDRGKRKIRLYKIVEMPEIKRGYMGLHDFINLYSTIKLAKPYEHIIHDHELTPEEAVVRAIETREYRVILASLFLFRHIKTWSELHRYAKNASAERFVGALYDLSRKYIRVRRMDKRIRNSLLASKPKKKWMIPHMKSKDFGNIEKLWGVYIPFNHQDMVRLKE